LERPARYPAPGLAYDTGHRQRRCAEGSLAIYRPL